MRDDVSGDVIQCRSMWGYIMTGDLSIINLYL